MTVGESDGADQRVRARYNTRSKLHELGDDLVIHDDVRVEVRGWTHEIDLHIAVVDGRLAAKEVHVRMAGREAPITSETIRGIPVASLVRYAAGAVKRVVKRRSDGGMTLDQAWPTEEDVQYVAEHGLDDETLRIIATTYRMAYLVGDPPTKRVEEFYSLSRATAGRWIAACRERGFLSDSRGPGKAGA